MNKGFLILGTYFLLLLGSSACQDDPECTETIYQCLSMIKLDSDLKYMIYNDSHYDISTNDLVDTINYENYGIQVSYEIKQEEMTTYFSNRMISSVYASALEQLPEDTISKIEIITHQDFNSSYLAGSNITNLFIESKSQNDIQDDLMNDPYFYIYNDVKYYVLTTSPEITKSYNFTVKYHFTNGKVLETITQKVVIQAQ